MPLEVPLNLLLLYNPLAASANDEGTSMTCSGWEQLNLGGCEEIKEFSLSLLSSEILEILVFLEQVCFDLDGFVSPKSRAWDGVGSGGL